METRDVLNHWQAAGPERWFSRDDAFDADLKDRFEAAHFSASRRELDHWADTPDGALALLILLDQFPRNCFRASATPTPRTPSPAIMRAGPSNRGFDRQVDPSLRLFFYLPFEHSEALADQDRSVALHESLAPELMKYALEHRDVIRRFRRFPHRNRALGRTNTPEEQAYLDAGGGFGG